MGRGWEAGEVKGEKLPKREGERVRPIVLGAGGCGRGMAGAEKEGCRKAGGWAAGAKAWCVILGRDSKEPIAEGFAGGGRGEEAMSVGAQIDRPAMGGLEFAVEYGEPLAGEVVLPLRICWRRSLVLRGMVGGGMAEGRRELEQAQVSDRTCQTKMAANALVL